MRAWLFDLAFARFSQVKVKATKLFYSYGLKSIFTMPGKAFTSEQKLLLDTVYFLV